MTLKTTKVKISKTVSIDWSRAVDLAYKGLQEDAKVLPDPEDFIDKHKKLLEDKLKVTKPSDLVVVVVKEKDRCFKIIGVLQSTLIV